MKKFGGRRLLGLRLAWWAGVVLWGLWRIDQEIESRCSSGPGSIGKNSGVAARAFFISEYRFMLIFGGDIFGILWGDGSFFILGGGKYILHL